MPSTPDQPLPREFNILSLYPVYAGFRQMLNIRLMLCIILCLFALNSNRLVHNIQLKSVMCNILLCNNSHCATIREEKTANLTVQDASGGNAEHIEGTPNAAAVAGFQGRDRSA